jgi:hypothetical protein
VWSIAQMIATVAALYDGVRWAVLPVFISGFGPLLVFIFSFYNKSSYWKLEKFDYYCGLFSLIALILWLITSMPIIAIIFAILSDIFAAIPTLIKSWNFPETETIYAYIAGLFNSLTFIAVVKTWNWSEVAFPIYLVIVNSLLIISVKQKYLFHKKQTT